jgi:hypothetical protein
MAMNVNPTVPRPDWLSLLRLVTAGVGAILIVQWLLSGA